MLTKEEKQARYQRMLVRWEKKSRIKKLKRDAIWNTKIVDANPTGELYQEKDLNMGHDDIVRDYPDRKVII